MRHIAARRPAEACRTPKRRDEMLHVDSFCCEKRDPSKLLARRIAHDVEIYVAATTNSSRGYNRIHVLPSAVRMKYAPLAALLTTRVTQMGGTIIWLVPEARTRRVPDTNYRTKLQRGKQRSLSNAKDQTERNFIGGAPNLVFIFSVCVSCYLCSCERVGAGITQERQHSSHSRIHRQRF